MATLVFSVACLWFGVIRGEREQRAWKLRLTEKTRAGSETGRVGAWSWKFLRRFVKKCSTAEIQSAVDWRT